MPVELTVKVEVPKGVRKSAGRRLGFKGGLRDRLSGRSRFKNNAGLLGRELAVGIGIGLGTEQKRRVSLTGKTVDRAPSRYNAKQTSRTPSGGKRIRLFWVSPTYPNAPNPLVETGAGAKGYLSSFDFHKKAGAGKPGKYSTSGGMWSGLTSVARGGSKSRQVADVMFRGRTEGQSVNLGTKKQRAARTKEARRARESEGKRALAELGTKGKKVSNALKAKSVAASHGVHVLKATTEERRSVAQTIEELLVEGIELRTGQAHKRRPSGGNPRIVRLMRRAVDGTISISRVIK